MDMKAQDLALKPAPKDLRKVVLATSIAETSVTIEGVPSSIAVLREFRVSSRTSA